MKQMHLVVAVLGMALGTAAHAQTVDVRVLVMKHERVAAPAHPFKDVGGFIIRQQANAYDKARCPNASDTKGELLCRIDCQKNDGTLRLYLRAPNQTAWPPVRGFVVPGEVGFDVADCAIVNAQPIRVTYKTQDVLFGELQASNPELFNALVENASSWDSKNPPRIKSFNQTYNVLVQQAIKDKTSVVKFAEISASLEAEAKVSKNTKLATTWGDYVVGSQSVALRQAAIDALGESGSQAVRISTKKADLLQSATYLEKAIEKKPALTPQDRSALQGVDSIRQNRMWFTP
jgi:hypothetical protein